MCVNYSEMLAELYSLWKTAGPYIAHQKFSFCKQKTLSHRNMRLVDMMMDYATCAVSHGQTSSVHSYSGHVTAISSPRTSLHIRTCRQQGYR